MVIFLGKTKKNSGKDWAEPKKTLRNILFPKSTFLTLFTPCSSWPLIGLSDFWKINQTNRIKIVFSLWFRASHAWQWEPELFAASVTKKAWIIQQGTIEQIKGTGSSHKIASKRVFGNLYGIRNIPESRNLTPELLESRRRHSSDCRIFCKHQNVGFLKMQHSDWWSLLQINFRFFDSWARCTGVLALWRWF